MAQKIEKCVLLSLKPQWWELIRSGEKTLEIRRTRPTGVVLPVRVIVYVSEPINMIVGEFLSGYFIRNSRSNFPNLPRRSRVPLDELTRYANGNDLFAWDVSDVTEYEQKMSLESMGIKDPPQEWRYMEVDVFWPD